MKNPIGHSGEAPSAVSLHKLLELVGTEGLIPATQRRSQVPTAMARVWGGNLDITDVLQIFSTCEKIKKKYGQPLVSLGN
jgi:hypothetical protein